MWISGVSLKYLPALDLMFVLKMTENEEANKKSSITTAI